MISAIVAKEFITDVAWPAVTSKVGLVVLTVGIGYVAYEGVPIGPLGRIPFGIGSTLEDWTGGRVRNEVNKALAGYVAKTELIASEAKNAELQRQLEAGRKAAEGFAALLKSAQEANAIQDAQYEQERIDFEKRLAGSGRSHKLDADDLNYILRGR